MKKLLLTVMALVSLSSVSFAGLVPGPSTPPPPYIDPNPPGQYDPYRPVRPEPAPAYYTYQWKYDDFGNLICVEITPESPEGLVVDNYNCEY